MMPGRSQAKERSKEKESTNGKESNKEKKACEAKDSCAKVNSDIHNGIKNMKSNKTISKSLIAMGFALVMLVNLNACEEEGPAEAAGENIDQMVEDAGNAIEDACENLKEEARAENPDC